MATMATRLTRPRVSQDNVLYKLAALVTGFLIQFDVVPAVWHVPLPRASQLPLLVFILYTVHLIAKKSNPLQTIFYWLVVVLLVTTHLAVSGAALHFGNQNIDLVITLSSAIYLLGGVGLYGVLAQRTATGWFCWGLLIGAALSLVTFVMQANGMAALATQLGLSPSHAHSQSGEGGGLTRLSGMWGHPNEVGHVLAMTAPAAGYLFLSRRTYLPFVPLALVVGTCFFFTANRGGIIAVLVTMVAVVFMKSEAGRTRRVSVLFAILFLFVAAAAIYLLPPPEFIYSRFFGDNAASENAAGRMLTTISGLEISFMHPLGMSFRDWQATMKQVTGFPTPHNGFIAFAIVLSIPFLLMLIGAFVAVIFAGLRQPRRLSLDILLMLLAIQASVSFMFEELANNDAFMIICGLILARVYSGVIDLPSGRSSRVRLRRSPTRSEQPVALQPLTREA